MVSKLVAIAVGGLFCLWLLWTSLTIVFANFQPEGLRLALAGAYLFALVAAAIFLRPRRRACAALLFAGTIVTVWYLLTWPSNDRDWQPDVAITPTATIDGERITIHGVRNFHYRSETDFDEHWEDRSYDLSKLRTLDLFLCYWGPVDYCHTILSFGFEGDVYLAASVEARKEKGESFSTFGGFFKMFELTYVFGDERDLIGLRTNHRKEDVYLYHMRVDPKRLRELFLAYARHTNRLAEQPEFYDVIENSCGVNILHRVAETGRTLWVGKEALLNGYWDRSFYREGAVSQEFPFEELRKRSRINERASDGADFSQRIREGLPAAPVFVPR